MEKVLSLNQLFRAPLANLKPMSRTIWISIGIGAVLVAGIVVVLVLRSRSVEPAESLAKITQTTPATPSRSTTPASISLTKEEQTIKAEVERLEKTLPQTISDTWSPELRKLMEERNARAVVTTSTIP